MSPSPFRDRDEFVAVIDRVLTMMSEDAAMGPRLREAGTPQRLEFPDLDLVVNVRAGGGDEGEGNLVWEWSDDVAWSPGVRTSMSSDTANRYFQGAENVAMAIATRRMRPSGDLRAALELVPLTKPVHGPYRAFLAAEHPHLLV